jgi:hypothetical protein
VYVHGCSLAVLTHAICRVAGAMRMASFMCALWQPRSTGAPITGRNARCHGIDCANTMAVVFAEINLTVTSFKVIQSHGILRKKILSASQWCKVRHHTMSACGLKHDFFESQRHRRQHRIMFGSRLCEELLQKSSCCLLKNIRLQNNEQPFKTHSRSQGTHSC